MVFVCRAPMQMQSEHLRRNVPYVQKILVTMMAHTAASAQRISQMPHLRTVAANALADNSPIMFVNNNPLLLKKCLDKTRHTSSIAIKLYAFLKQGL